MLNLKITGNGAEPLNKIISDFSEFNHECSDVRKHFSFPTDVLSVKNCIR